MIPAPASSRILLGPEEILQMRAIDGRPAPGRGLQDVLAAMGHQAPAHKGHVGGAIQGEEVADGVDDHHRMRAGLPAGLESGPQMAGKAAPGKEARQVGGALGMPGGQHEA